MENFDSNSSSSVEDGKTIAIISYLTLIGLIVAFVMNNDKKNFFASSHILQSLGIMLTGMALSFLIVIPFLGWIAFLVGWLFVVLMWVTGLLIAQNSKDKPVIGLGVKFQEWFSSLRYGLLFFCFPFPLL